MEKLEVILLVRTIKANYPGFDQSPENIDRLHKYLQDFPYQVAMHNVNNHILTERFPPNIAEIRGRVGELLERDRLRAATDKLFAEMDAARAAAVPPPRGLKEKIYARLLGNPRD
ncbi:replicative helicase loader/inhibitor [Paenibacillus wynnii]|uniref:Uncharacterized protein n=1 Tax=Paenibacillus wynnii TaxID=268407 RepID=A0A098M6E9_9BACL|nr:replicative helicase loader/inhibitor [Paenibacillus wynnii]KGE17591.1 hypothetical protein PWYN_23680 [Paenibacillus wynnii]